ncbi:deleted in malignant brain tumors 1 protein-like [Liolophura sinensis]|uniref:deleted in malignant brain tumors 1 protein-like n=1 Tax=Liolophura sinensis TaxID=3198878 RepID=UPI0031594771
MVRLMVAVLTALVTAKGLLTTAHADFSNAVVLHQSADQLMRVHGLKERWGQVEVRMSSSDPTWYPVCYSERLFFGDKEQKIANWICQTRLGLTVSYAEAEYGQPLSPDTPSVNAECPYHRTCTFSLGSECTTNTTLFIYCPASESRDLSLRLTGGPDERRGRLEMLRNGEWGTICGETFSLLNAKVVCRQMGFNESLAHFYYLDGMATGNTSLKRVRCTGNEQRLIECFHMFLGFRANSCKKAAGVECRRSDDYSPRLAHTKNLTMLNGRLDVKIGGQWKALCGTMAEETIRVACREMGLPSSFVLKLPTSIKYPSENIPITTVDFSCWRSPSNLSQCRVYPGYGDCNETFGIMCSDDPRYDVRLVGGDNSRGRLEVKIGGIWGTVCNNTFTDRSAKVACRTLGFNNSVPLVWPNKGFGQADLEQPIWLNTVRCDGSETSLRECHQSTEHKTQCSHETDVVISCKSLEELDMPIRLVDGPDITAGRLEIFLNGQWGTVCKYFFRDISGQVACRQMGLPYKDAIITRHVPISDPATGPIWLGDLQCGGEESHIIQCSHGPIGTTACSHADDVDLKCENRNKYIGNPYTTEKPKSDRVLIGDGIVSAVMIILLIVAGCCAKKKYDKRANSAGGEHSSEAIALQYTPGTANSSPAAPGEGRASVCLGEEQRTSVCLGEEQRASVCLGEEQRASVCLGEEQRASVCLGEAQRGIVCLGEEQRASVCLGEEQRASVCLGKNSGHLFALGKNSGHLYALGKNSGHLFALGKHSGHLFALGKHSGHLFALGKQSGHLFALGKHSGHLYALGKNSGHLFALGKNSGHLYALGKNSGHQFALGKNSGHLFALVKHSGHLFALGKHSGHLFALGKHSGHLFALGKHSGELYALGKQCGQLDLHIAAPMIATLTPGDQITALPNTSDAPPSYSDLFEKDGVSKTTSTPSDPKTEAHIT